MLFIYSFQTSFYIKVQSKLYLNLPNNSWRVIRRLANNSLLALLISNINKDCLGTLSPSMWKSILNCGLGIAGKSRDFANVLPLFVEDVILSGLVHLINIKDFYIIFCINIHIFAPAGTHTYIYISTYIWSFIRQYSWAICATWRPWACKTFPSIPEYFSLVPLTTFNSDVGYTYK